MSSLFRPAVELLEQYARHHRDQRNITTHVLGVPLVVFGAGVLLARPAVALGGWALTPAWALWALAGLWYLSRGLPGLGLVTAGALALLVALAQPVGSGGVAGWLGWGTGCVLLGGTFQLLGHYYEGRRPYVAREPVGLLVGPMFVTLELLAVMGWQRGLLARVERHAGPPMLRNLAHPTPR